MIFGRSVKIAGTDGHVDDGRFTYLRFNMP